MYEHAIFIGRFQPVHNAHIATIRYALTQAEHLIIVVGSDNQARDTRNPWSTAERIDMIRRVIHDENIDGHVDFVAVEDYLYNDNMWIAEVQRAVASLVGKEDAVLVGHAKDPATSFYLKLFPQWDFLPTDLRMAGFDSTRIRELMFEHDKIGLKSFLPKCTYEDVSSFMETDEFERLREEHKYIQEYRSMWKGAPFPPTFNTVDAIVIRSGHVLVVRRGGAPGKGLIALPGGYLNVNEKVFDGAIRELKEETKIKLPVDELKKALVDEKVFDHPKRSLRGRTITHAFCLDLGRGELPVVQGSDDADKAWWMSLDDVHSKKSSFFEDHYHIITYFVNRI